MRRIPLFYPIFLLSELAVVIFYRLPRWLLGFWECGVCNKTYSFREAKHEELAYGYDGCYVTGVHCGECEKLIRNSEGA